MPEKTSLISLVHRVEALHTSQQLTRGKTNDTKDYTATFGLFTGAFDAGETRQN